jgi:hypothetical protein
MISESLAYIEEYCSNTTCCYGDLEREEKQRGSFCVKLTHLAGGYCSSCTRGEKGLDDVCSWNVVVIKVAKE